MLQKLHEILGFHVFLHLGFPSDIQVIPGVDHLFFVFLFMGSLVNMVDRHVAAHEKNIGVDVLNLLQFSFPFAKTEKYLLRQIFGQILVAKVFDKKSENLFPVTIENFLEVHLR